MHIDRLPVKDSTNTIQEKLRMGTCIFGKAFDNQGAKLFSQFIQGDRGRYRGYTKWFCLLFWVQKQETVSSISSEIMASSSFSPDVKAISDINTNLEGYCAVYEERCVCMEIP